MQARPVTGSLPVNAFQTLSPKRRLQDSDKQQPSAKRFQPQVVYQQRQVQRRRPQRSPEEERRIRQQQEIQGALWAREIDQQIRARQEREGSQRALQIEQQLRAQGKAYLLQQPQSPRSFQVSGTGTTFSFS